MFSPVRLCNLRVGGFQLCDYLVFLLDFKLNFLKFLLLLEVFFFHLVVAALGIVVFVKQQVLAALEGPNFLQMSEVFLDAVRLEEGSHFAGHLSADLHRDARLCAKLAEILVGEAHFAENVHAVGSVEVSLSVGSEALALIAEECE